MALSHTRQTTGSAQAGRLPDQAVGIGSNPSAATQAIGSNHGALLCMNPKIAENVSWDLRSKDFKSFPTCGLKRIPSPNIENITTRGTQRESTADARDTLAEPGSGTRRTGPGTGRRTLGSRRLRVPETPSGRSESGCALKKVMLLSPRSIKNYILRRRCLTFLQTEPDFRGPD